MKVASMLKETGRTITVGGAGCDIEGFDSTAIRSAVEGLLRGGGGGTIQLVEGEYRVTGQIRLYDGMTLAGAGSKTILRKSEGVKTRFVLDADYGELQATVEDSSGFEPGMGLQLYDETNKWGFCESTATITRIEGNKLFFDRHLERDYISEDGGTVTNACSLIEVLDARNVRIMDLVVDGNGDVNYPIGGCRAGGIYLYKAGNCRIRDVEVRGFNGDGVSWQITEDIEVRHCVVTDCTGSGLHPGAGSVRSIIADCTLERNGLAGLFICWRVQFGEFSRNRICGNVNYGISIGHKDSFNLFTDNVISENGSSGVLFRGEKPGNGSNGNRWVRNVIEDNGSPEEGGYGIQAIGAAADNVFVGNRIGDTGTGRQKANVWLGEAVSGFTFE
ncbi:right-handed parallel beta-helix repeat-containing protein [Paenibacillus silvisoli]|uniref:right-handed parallel beta-helix repeat-containing protein n=1 Tax=Paenibacillus silvisoli TaxID=3110539 RepID=UPI0028049131|nr:right-handed parallel beta-helix repeat-containing protein [Paenibacillus silvisoli]